MFVKRNSVFFFRILDDSRQLSSSKRRRIFEISALVTQLSPITAYRYLGVREISDRVIGQLVEGYNRFAKAIINYHLLSQLLPRSFEKNCRLSSKNVVYISFSIGYSIRWRDYNPFCTQFYFTAWAHFPSWRVI